MTHKQHPIGSNFNAASTAEDVIAGIDLSGRTAVVIAGHVGLGLETTRALSAAGATVVVGARSAARAAAALADLDRIEVYDLDLTDPASIDRFATRFTESGSSLDVLVNNAGIMGGELVRDARGFESQFSTNHLGHFQLTRSLVPALRAAGGARVVTVSSWGHHLSGIRWGDPNYWGEQYGWRERFDGMTAYGQSKTANVLFAVELDRRYAADGIRSYALHPGGIHSTNLAPWIAGDIGRAMGLIDDDGNPIIDPARDRKTPQQGASTAVWAATSPLLDQIGGVYLQDNDIAPLEDIDEPLTIDVTAGPMETTVGVTRYAVDPEAAQLLWALSENLTS